MRYDQLPKRLRDVVDEYTTTIELEHTNSLSRIFIWSLSKEGNDYWQKIHRFKTDWTAEIFETFEEEQKLQGNEPDFTLLIGKKDGSGLNKSEGAFSWINSRQGHNVWRNLLEYKDSKLLLEWIKKNRIQVKEVKDKWLELSKGTVAAGLKFHQQRELKERKYLSKISLLDLWA